MIDLNLNYELKCGYTVISLEHHADNEEGGCEDGAYELVVVKVKVTKWFVAYRKPSGFDLSPPFDRRKQAEEFIIDPTTELIKIFSKSFEL